jgi:hypothetical protein
VKTNYKLMNTQLLFLRGVALLVLASFQFISFGQNLLEEDFSEIIEETIFVPPSGWTINNIDGNSDQVVFFGNSPTRTIHDIGVILAPYAIFDAGEFAGVGQSRNIALESPEFDGSNPGYAYIFVNFHYQFEGIAGGKIVVEVLNSTLNWITILELQSPTVGFTNGLGANIPTSLWHDQMKVRFRWEGADAGYFMLDNVNVTAPYENDIGVFELQSSEFVGKLDAESSIDYILNVGVTSYGTESVHDIKIHYELSDGVSIIATDLQDFGTEDLNTFFGGFAFTNPITFTALGSYDLKAWTETGIDSDNSNDTLFATINVMEIVIVAGGDSYSETFDTDLAGWVPHLFDQSAGNSWEQTDLSNLAPFNSTDLASGGVIATSANNFFIPVERSAIRSPFLDLSAYSSDNIIVSFDLLFDGETIGSGEMPQTLDAAAMYLIIDDEEYELTSSISDSWYNYYFVGEEDEGGEEDRTPIWGGFIDWESKSIAINFRDLLRVDEGSVDKSNIQFQILFFGQSNSGKVGMAFDNFEVRELLLGHVYNTELDGPGSFSQAVADVNSDPSLDEVVFEISDETIYILEPKEITDDRISIDATGKIVTRLFINNNIIYDFGSAGMALNMENSSINGNLIGKGAHLILSQ